LLILTFLAPSFSEVVTPDLIFDTIGREGTGSIDAMRQMRGTKYVSVMPAILKVAVDEGVIFGGSKLLAYKKALDGNGQARGWIPHMAAMGHIARTTRLIQQGEIVPRGLQSGFIGMQEYLETLSWPKDSDTGLRYVSTILSIEREKVGEGAYNARSLSFFDLIVWFCRALSVGRVITGWRTR
jgi:hypothetical protein